MPTTAATKTRTKVRHPYAFSLDLMRQAIDRLPPGFPAKKAKEFAGKLQDLSKRPDAPYAEIQSAIAALGKQSWPYRKAFEELYERYGRSSEESNLLTRLDLGLRDKYARFLNDGGKLNHIESAKSGTEIWSVSQFERFFTPEEKFGITQALIGAREGAREEIETLVEGQRRAEYEALITKFERRRGVMEDKLHELRSLADVSPKWRDEILNQVSTFEEGWSVVERQLDLAELDKLIEYWRGTLESFLAA